MRGGWTVWCVLAGTLACCGGDDDAPPGDAGAEEAAPDATEIAAPALPAPPTPSARPILTPCAAGWTAVPDPSWAEVVTCDPAPGGVPSCEGAQAWFPGDEGCGRIGTEAPADGWPAAVEAEGDLYHIDPAAVEGGDGTRLAPFRTIAEALALAGDGDVVALRSGRHPGPVVLDEDVTLWGASAEDTIVDGRDASVAIHVRSGARLHDLTIEGGETGILADTARGRARIDEVIVQGALETGIGVDDASADLFGVAVRDGGAESVGLWLHGGDVVADRVSVERPGAFGIILDAGARLAASALTIADTTQGDPTQAAGTGLFVGEGAIATLSASLLSDLYEAGAHVDGIGSELTIADSAIRDVRRPDRAGTFEGWGAGAFASGGALLRLERVTIDRTHAMAVGILDAGTVLDAEDLVTRETSAEIGRFWATGFGIGAFTGAAGTVTRAAIRRATAGGVVVSEGSDLVLRDLLAGEIQLVQTELGATFGSGVEVSAGARVELHAAEIVDNDGLGVYAVERAALVADDLRVTGSSAGSPGENRTRGLIVGSGSTADLHRVALEGSRGCGLALDIASTATGADIDVRDTASSVTDGRWGQGVSVDLTSSLTLARLRVVGNHTAGMWFGRSAVGQLEDVTIAETEPAECAPDCEGGGMGLQVVASATVDVRRFAITDNALAGVQVATGGDLSLHDGLVARNVIGANVQDLDFDESRLQDHVVWRDNERAFDASILPIPGAPAQSEEADAEPACRPPTGDEVPLDVALEPIGAPTWEPRGFFQTSVLSADEEWTGLDVALNDLLAPRHLFDGGAIFWGLAHAPPYDDEWALSLSRASCSNGSRFTVEEVSAPRYWMLFFVLVPLEGSPLGRSPDGPDGPVLGNDVYPMTFDGDVLRDGEVYDPDFDGMLGGMEDMGEAGSDFDGFSHQVYYLYSDLAGGGPGHYVLDQRILDDTGAGWHVVSSFDVE